MLPVCMKRESPEVKFKCLNKVSKSFEDEKSARRMSQITAVAHALYPLSRV